MSDLNNIKYANTIFDEIDAFFSPTVLLSIVVMYLLFVYQIGPRWLKNRAAFELKNFISFYNVVQVAACLHLIYRIWKLASWNIFYFRTCIYYTQDSPEQKTYVDIMLQAFLIKLFELVDTIVFVLRKKQSQVTLLHTFHHVSMLTLTYVSKEHYTNGGGLFGYYLNSWVHVIMYSYYFFANICSADVMKKMVLIKKSITIIQMIQFSVILTQVVLTCVYCSVPLTLTVYYIFIVIVIFYGFYDFYKKSYSNNQTSKQKQKE